MKFKRIIASSLFALLAIGVQAQPGKDFELNKNLDIFFSAFRELRTLYVDTLNTENLIRLGIDGMVSKLDPYTEFVPQEDVGDFDFMTTGRYAGIGALIQKDSSYARISEPYKGFPADQASLVSGDRLLAIDGKDLKGMDLDKISNMLKGAHGTAISLKVVKLRGGDTLTLALKRRNIHISGIVYSGLLDNGIGYIRLTSFTEGCSKDFRDALMELRKTDKMKSLVIDLRSNGGGLLDEAVKIVALFVPKGTEVASVRGREKQVNMAYITKDHPVDTQIPIAVLVNSGTASASEIVSGSLQDLDRGIIVGTRTFGKGLVQTIRPTGYDTKMKITTGKYYIPSGRCVQAHNFSQRNEDGSVASIPDSLIKAFKTKNGRTVYDGGGITPDIKTESEEYSRIAVSLLQRGLITDYSINYFAINDKIASPEEFKITDTDYQNFITFLSNKTYDYQTVSERLLKQLTEAVKYEKYDTETKTEIDALSEKLKHDKLKDLQIFKPEISQLLEEEIVNRYYYQWGRVQTMLRSDKQLDAAKKALLAPVEYVTTLAGTAPIAKK